MADPSVVDSIAVLVAGKYVLDVEVKSDHDQLRDLWDRVQNGNTIPAGPIEEIAPFRKSDMIKYLRFDPPLPREGWREAISGSTRKRATFIHVVRCQTTEYDYIAHKRAGREIMFAFDLPKSLAESPCDGKPKHAFRYREFPIFCHERSLVIRRDWRFNTVYPQVHSVIHSKDSTPLLVKYARRSELDIYQALADLRSSDTGPSLDPSHLSELLTIFPPLLLPENRCFLTIPDYGFSLFLCCENDYAPTHCRYSTLWECTHHLVSAVEFLHAHGIVHRDIKPQNVTVNFKKYSTVDPYPSFYARPFEHRPCLMLIDFSAAESGLTLGESKRRGLYGTHGYMPPEIANFIAPGTQPRLRTPHPETDHTWFIPYIYPTDEEKEAAWAAFDASAVPSYCPFSADVWCTGNIISLLGGMSQDPAHRAALEELGAHIMDSRPSSSVVDGQRSELSESVYLREKGGLPRVEWAVEVVEVNTEMPL